MKNQLFFAPLLWLRKILLFVLVLLIILGLLLFFVANSPLAIKKVADIFAGDYNITYDDIKGSVLSGIEIENLQFQNKKLAKKIKLKWNPNTLVAKTITINTLDIEDANVDVIKGMIASFSTEENASGIEDNASSFDYAIKINNIELSLLPFIQNNIAIGKATLKSKMISYKTDAFYVDDLDFVLDTNISNLTLKGSMKEQIAMLSNLNLRDVNLSALIALFPTESNASKETNTSREEKSASIFIPKRVKVDKIDTNILPFTYSPVEVKQITFGASDVVFDVEHLVLVDATLELNGTTNLSNATYKGSAHKNKVLGTINLTPNHRLYKRYGLPLRKEAIAHVIVDFNASSERVVANVQAKGKNILEGKKGAFNVDINRFFSHVVYDMNSSYLTADTKAFITTPYAENIELTNIFMKNKKISYKGEAKVKKLMGFDEKLTTPLNDLKVLYRGDDKSIQTKLNSRAFKGTFDSKDFKTAHVHLETIAPIELSKLVTLPKELNTAKVNLVADAPLDFSKLSTINTKVKVTSNVLNINANVGYGKNIEVKGKVDIPKESLLKTYNKEVKWETLSPVDAHAKLSDASLALKLKAKALHADVNYAPQQGKVNGSINIGGLVTHISGNTKQKLKIQTKITSMKALVKNISTLYPLDALPPVEGSLTATLLVDKLKTAELTLTSPKLIYKADKMSKHTIKNVKLVAQMDASKIILKSYQGILNKQKYFSTKKAVIILGDTIKVSNLWVNDSLHIAGNYNTQNKKGTFIADAKNFHIKDKIADIYTKIHLKTKLDGNNTTVQGKIVLLKGRITPDLQAGHTFATDSDIIILQEIKKKQKSPFMQNLTLALKIETKKALRLKKGPINVRLKPDFTINKDKGGELLYLGSVELLKGGSYVFQEKRFVLGKSFVYFTGDVTKPLLDIKANYQAINYLITIAISGTPAEPNITFSSSPALTREQILSVILFDSEAGGDTHSGTDMMKMMGGAMAKAALSDVGISVDHLVFGEGNSVEVGKKLTNKITVIYINGVVPKIKLKYQHSKHTESVIGVSEESQSYDIIYKKDF